MKKDYQTHVFTCTYTADVSGVCSAMYELGGMSVLHDPSGCNSTYSTHDEPRWFDTDSLMFVSGLDEITAVMGDDEVLIRDVVQAAKDLNPRFITLCGASIPHIIAFDYRGVAYLMENECGIPVLPVPTDGLKSYTSGAGLAFTAWIERFADPSEYAQAGERAINLLGVTPLDFSVNGNVREMRKTLERAGYCINACMAMEDTFEDLTHIYRAKCNVVVSGAGRKAAKYMKRKAGIPYVEGLPIGADAAGKLAEMIGQSITDGKCRTLWEEEGDLSMQNAPAAKMIPDESSTSADKHSLIIEKKVLIIGEGIFANSLAYGINHLMDHRGMEAGKDTSAKAGMASAGSMPHNHFLVRAMWPDEDEGIAEEPLIAAMKQADIVIADPLYRVVLGKSNQTHFIDFPHEAYSGRIYRSRIPVFASDSFSVEELLAY